MKYIEVDCQATSDLNPLQDWTIDADDLLKNLAKDTAQLVETVKKHFLKVGKISRKIQNLAEEAQESRQAQLFFRQNFSPALRKDIEKGRRFWDYTQQLDEMEDDINFVLSNTGFDVANTIISKLADTLSKVEFPGVLGDPISKKIEVAANILIELVEQTLKEKEGVDKGVKSSDLSRLIKLNSVPDCDRVEFKEAHTTYRAEIVEYCPDADVVKVRIDGSGEEKEIPRGTIALKEQKPPKLHEPCLIQGNEVADYNRCGIFKALIADDKALVLLLDGRLVEVPKKSIIKGKKGSPIPELLHLLDESGNTEKLSLAVEKAREETTKVFQKQVDELTKEVGKAYKDGQEFAATKVQPKISLDVFLGIPIEEKVEIFKSQPDETKSLILADYVKLLPVEKVDRPVAEIKAPVTGIVDRPVVKTSTSVSRPVSSQTVDVKAVAEVENPVAEPVAIDMTRFAKKDLTETLPVAPTAPSLEDQIKEAEEEYTKASAALEARERELGVEPGSHLTNYVVKKQCTTEEKVKRSADTKRCRLKLELKARNQPAVQEPEPTRAETIFSEEDIAKADELLLKGYRAIKSGAKVQTLLNKLSVEFPQSVDYLVSVFGKEWLCLYYFENAADIQLIVQSLVPNHKEADAILARAQDCWQELDELAGYYRKANFSALEKVDTRLKLIAELLLTKEDIAAIEVGISKPKTQVPSKEARITTGTKDDPATSSYSIETIKEWLCGHQLQSGITYLNTNGIALTDVFSPSELQAMYDGGGQKQVNAITLVDRFKCRKLINFESIANFGSKNQKLSSPQPRQLPPKVERMGSSEEILGGF